MRCPHTIELYDFGVTADGAFYYVMELLDGFDLETLVTTHGPLPAPRAVPLLRQLCHSLAEAHERRLIHRDIKPANVFVCRYGREVDWVKVLDFGLVKRERGAERRGGDLKLTAEDAIGGTPAFMAPEQVLGRPVDGRTDLYAVGCLAYWMLTGCLVFEGANALETMMHHTSTPPTPPSRRAELPIPQELERIVLDCLAKEPGDRPATADVLSRRLAAVPLSDAWTEDRARAWWERYGVSRS
jgi:serine/threonine-protein kinase